MTGDRLRCNRTSHCALCAVLAPGTLNLSRVFIGGEVSADDRAGVFAVCPVHDIAGPASALPDSIRRAVTP